MGSQRHLWYWFLADKTSFNPEPVMRKMTFGQHPIGGITTLRPAPVSCWWAVESLLHGHLPAGTNGRGHLLSGAGRPHRLGEM